MKGAYYQSTIHLKCHAIAVDDGIDEPISNLEDDGSDILDLAIGLTETCNPSPSGRILSEMWLTGEGVRKRASLGYQVGMGKEIDGLAAKLPSMTRNFQLSDLSKKGLFLTVDVSIVEL